MRGHRARVPLAGSSGKPWLPATWGAQRIEALPVGTHLRNPLVGFASRCSDKDLAIPSLFRSSPERTEHGMELSGGQESVCLRAPNSRWPEASATRKINRSPVQPNRRLSPHPQETCLAVIQIKTPVRLSIRMVLPSPALRRRLATRIF